MLSGRSLALLASNRNRTALFSSWSFAAAGRGLIGLFLLCSGGIAWAQVDPFLTTAEHEEPLPLTAAALQELIGNLQEELQVDPENASTWRMLGVLRRQQNQQQAALEAFQRAISLDPLSAAAFHDLGDLAQELGDYQMAADAFARVQELAPESAYAISATGLLAEIQTNQRVVPAAYSMQRFDGAELEGLTTERLDDPDPSWLDALDLRIDLTSQYNTNVSLAPSSRELSPNSPDSFQGTSSVFARYFFINHDSFRLGPTIDFDFNINEGNLDRFNLQSYRPGIVADGKYAWGDINLKPRVAYSFDHDEFGGKSFGNRHTIASSLGAAWNSMHTTTLYHSLDYNNLINDGADPALSSQDGWSNSIGLMHDIVDRQSRFRLWRLGTDFQNADTQGDAFRFRGCSVFTQAIFVPVKTIHLTCRGGWVFRDYPDFIEIPSRNTHILRGGLELRKYFEGGFSTALFTQVDDFSSRNDRFDSTRFISGGTMTWEY